jgi:hypothetical protein
LKEKRWRNFSGIVFTWIFNRFDEARDYPLVILAAAQLSFRPHAKTA